MSTKNKWITILVFTLVLLALTMFGAFMIPKQSSFVYENTAQLKGREIGGVATKMPNSSVRIFLNGYFGVDFGKITEFKDFNTALCALDNRRVPAIWATDVTADYLKEKGGYRVLRASETPGSGEERLEFAFAFRKKDEVLRDLANDMLERFESNGTTDRLYRHFVYGTDNDSLCGVLGKGRTLHIGVTGAVPPLEMVDGEGNASGMAVELAKYLAAFVDMKAEIIVLDNETAFTALMSGKVDMIACYGTSENHSTEFPEYIMSDGYCSMKEYCLIVK